MGRRKEDPTSGGQAVLQPTQPTFEVRKATKPEPAPPPKPKPEPAIDPTRLITVHSGYAGKRKDGQFVDSDWPDIEARAGQGAAKRTIASDYDAELEELNFFIESWRRREAKLSGKELSAPGEALALR